MLGENLFPLSVAVEKATGIRPHYTTILRWINKGQNGVKLESTMLGGRRLTSTDAVLRYMDRVTEARSGTSEPIATPRQVERAAARSAQLLKQRLSKSTR